jgi:hypothetical protein
MRGEGAGSRRRVFLVIDPAPNLRRRRGSLRVDGPVVIPLFERMERDLAAMRAEQDTVERAKRLLETYSGRLPARRPPNPS